MRHQKLTMKKMKFTLPLLALLLVFVSACRNDDDNGAGGIPFRDRDDESAVSQLIIEKYLQTHFYNYEEFANPPADFDFRITFDTIAGDNSDKIPLIEQVRSKMVQDRIELDVMYKLYYLVVEEGEGETIQFPDVALANFRGISLDERFIVDEDDLDGDGDTEEDIEIYPTELFDQSVNPANFDLTGIVNGLQDAFIEFKTASDFTTNGDGTISFNGFGNGAVFIPTGLGYFAEPPPGPDGGPVVPIYSQLIFSFQLFNRLQGDQDGDTIPSIFEDRNGNGIEEDDDTDEDGQFDVFDADDDNDGRLTRDEVVQNMYTVSPGDDDPTLASNEIEVNREIDEVTGIITITTITFTDTDGDGVADYIDADS